MVVRRTCRFRRTGRCHFAEWIRYIYDTGFGAGRKLKGVTMNLKLGLGVLAGPMFVVLAFLTSGCNQTDNSGDQRNRGKGANETKPGPVVAEEKKGHDHDGWWCDEHG